MKATFAVVMATACGVILGTSGTASAGAASDGGVTLCRKYQHMRVQGAAGQRYIIRNDNYGGKRECITNHGGGPNFTVTASAANGNDRRRLAYPYIFLGCSWGLCTPGGGLPARVSGLRDPLTTWTTSLTTNGVWNATYDIWFNKTPITTGQATGGELMIWLNSRGDPRPGPHAKIVWVGDARWYLKSWITAHAGHRWRLIQFRRVRPVSRVAGLHLSGFIQAMEQRGWIGPSYWMLNIEAGFEITRGGKGLATTFFRARS